MKCSRLIEIFSRVFLAKWIVQACANRGPRAKLMIIDKQEFIKPIKLTKSMIFFF